MSTTQILITYPNNTNHKSATRGCSVLNPWIKQENLHPRKPLYRNLCMHHKWVCHQQTTWSLVSDSSLHLQRLRSTFYSGWETLCTEIKTCQVLNLCGAVKSLTVCRLRSYVDHYSTWRSRVSLGSHVNVWMAFVHWRNKTTSASQTHGTCRTASSPGQDSAVLHVENNGHSFEDSNVHGLSWEDGWFERGVNEVLYLNWNKHHLTEVA